MQQFTDGSEAGGMILVENIASTLMQGVFEIAAILTFAELGVRE